MMKAAELFNPSSCLNKSQPNEPVFVLVGRDPTAPQTIRLWATMNEGRQPPEKLAEAMNLADEMDKWRACSMPQAIAKDARVDLNQAHAAGYGRAEDGRYPPGLSSECVRAETLARR